jgi:hypothetical protein
MIHDSESPADANDGKTNPAEWPLSSVPLSGTTPFFPAAPASDKDTSQLSTESPALNIVRLQLKWPCVRTQLQLPIMLGPLQGHVVQGTATEW